LDDPGEHRTLGDRQLVDVLVEVRLRGGLYPVRAATEIDRVDVVLEDLVLGQLIGDLDRKDDFLVLAPQGEVVLSGRHLDVLLGDRRTAADAAGELIPDGPADTHDVEAGVGVERAVLGGEHCLLHVLGHLVERDEDPVAVLRADGGERAAVGVGERGHLGKCGLFRGGHREQQPSDEERQERAEEAEAEQNVEDPPNPPPRRGRLARRRPRAAPGVGALDRTFREGDGCGLRRNRRGVPVLVGEQGHAPGAVRRALLAVDRRTVGPVR
jgi:hypothetical protein